MRQELSVTHLLLESVSRVYGASEIVTRSALQHMVKQTNNFTEEKKMDPVCVCVRKQNMQKKMQEECLDISCKFNDLEEKSVRGLYRGNDEFNRATT